MDTVFSVCDFINANLGTIVTVAFAGVGVLSQAAAAFNLSGLAQVSTTLHNAVQFAAGNWGYATNIAKVVETYRTAGPAAALAQLATLAAPTTPKDGGGTLTPPGSASAALILALALGAGGLSACDQISARIDALTDTTLAQRCQLYKTGDVAADALAATFPELAGVAAIDDAAVKGLCGQPAGSVQKAAP